MLISFVIHITSGLWLSPDYVSARFYTLKLPVMVHGCHLLSTVSQCVSSPKEGHSVIFVECCVTPSKGFIF